MENNNSAQVQQRFTDTKREVENYREQIAAKNVEMPSLISKSKTSAKRRGRARRRDGAELARANAFDASGT